MKLFDLETSFDFAAVGRVITDMEKAREGFNRKLTQEITKISLDLMVDLFKTVFKHTKLENNFFNQVQLPLYFSWP